jgi:hypothetical protein
MFKRFAIALTTVTTLASGCATLNGGDCQMDSNGNCGRSTVVNAALGLGALVVIGGVYLLYTQVAKSTKAPAAVAPANPGLTGHVRWQGSSAGVPSVRVTLRRGEGPVLETTTTDAEGRFQFPFPHKADYYTLAVEADTAEGNKSLWLQDRGPDALDLFVVPRAAHAPWGMRSPAGDQH